MRYYLTSMDGVRGAGITPDGTFPSGAVECTEAQYNDADAWIVSGAAIISYSPPAPTLAQQAAAVLGAGLTITLSGSLTLSATLFPTDPVTTNKIGAVITTVMATQKFPDGSTNFPMKDSAGAWHVFTVAQYTAVAAAISSYVSALDLIADGNPLNATALPSSSVAIAV